MGAVPGRIEEGRAPVDRVNDCLAKEVYIEKVLCNINRIDPYTVGWAIDSRLDVQTLRSFRYGDRREQSYREFSIPKKNGGVRLISAPVGNLKDILSGLSLLLSPKSGKDKD